MYIPLRFSTRTLLFCFFLKKWGVFPSVQFSRSLVSDSLRTHESRHARPPCPSPTPGAHSDSCPSSWWCHPAISSSVVPFSSCPQSLPASESFPTSQLFAWGGQSPGVSALASFLPKKCQGWSPSVLLLLLLFCFLLQEILILFFILFYFLTLQYCIGFAIYRN